MRFDDDQWLEGLDGTARDQRRKLLALLAREGFSEDELRVAIAENRLALLPVDRLLGGTYTAREIEERSGLPAEVMTRVRRTIGLAEPGIDDRVFSEADIEAARSTKLFLDAGFSVDAITEISAVLGEGMSRLSATITAAFLQTFLRAGDSEEDVALRFAELAEQLTPAIEPILVSGFNAHLRDAVRRGMLGRRELDTGEPPLEQELCICFADLVGFTRMGSEVAVGELGSVAGRLGRLAVGAARPPVRLIKTIGDAAMFVSPGQAPIVQVALDLVDAVAAEDLPSLRAGIAFGRVTVRAGDYFGNTVNVASRVTGAARPGSVLCTAEVRDACRDEFDWSFAGRHRLKGVAGPVPLYRAHPPRARP
ncbi:MAG TPA: adenylate cyclase regulatory domain-containing protein [Solirubrobacteraceae bacterium]|nr:adenylate cyclase regulatory domain-containing protein [Solirubrobacteraceae bacterium]